MTTAETGVAVREPASTSRSSAMPRVLVVDDSRSVVALLRGFLAHEGYEVVVATNGLEAMERFTALPPDLVLMDVMMPELDGIETVRRMRATGAWLPVIFLSSLDTEDDAVRALEAGGDDFVSKPVNLSILRAKMRSMARIAALQREYQRQAAELRAALDEDLAEQELAQSLISNIVLREGVNDRAVEWSVLPSQRFSGDVVAAARASDGALYALLADATGHGLTASVSLIPALQVFYGMAKKGLSVPALVAEMNSRLKDLMPVGRYIAAAVVRLDPDGLSGVAWNGGMPALLLLDPEGGVCGSLPSLHLPLGILAAGRFDPTPVSFQGVRGGFLAAFSDGVLEAAAGGGPEFSAQGALDALRGVAAGRRMAALQAALQAHLGGTAPTDDASALLVHLG